MSLVSLDNLVLYIWNYFFNKSYTFFLYILLEREKCGQN